jgi:hypothetical protein
MNCYLQHVFLDFSAADMFRPEHRPDLNKFKVQNKNGKNGIYAGTMLLQFCRLGKSKMMSYMFFESVPTCYILDWTAMG